MKFRKVWKANRPRNLENLDRQREKYPNVVNKVIEISDFILEVLDARFPEETRNKEIEEKIKSLGKRLIFVLNKCDLVNKNNIKLAEDIKPYVFISCKKRWGSRILRNLIKKEIQYRDKKFKRAQVGIIGYPNTGKSSLINFLIGKQAAKTAKEAGFTKGIQKIKLASNILLLDTPGVIPLNKYSSDDPILIKHHALVGARNYDRVKNPDFIVQDLLEKHSEEICSFYKTEKTKSADEFLEKLGRKKNFLIKGGKVDTDRTARLVLKDWQEGNFVLKKKDTGFL